MKNPNREVYLDSIKGCLFGGAVGDALGYPVEFFEEDEIFARYGKDGIQQYEIDQKSGKALISDDTQMTLFTANGLLAGDTRAAMRGIGMSPCDYVAISYQDWLRTQEMSFQGSRAEPWNERDFCFSWLMDVPELYSRRAPGNTCLSALRCPKTVWIQDKDFMEKPLNDSKGCGGIMRVAPIALRAWPDVDIREIDCEGARIAALTHGHSLGYMPAAVLTHILRRIVYPEKPQTLKEIVLEARDCIAEIFVGDKHLKKLTDVIHLAVRLSENEKEDLENIRQIGEGWVGEETLGIAVYCSLRHPDHFSVGVAAAVNHGGDSDSTGAVTGNILGALLGYTGIEEKWKRNLELHDVILEMAEDLCYGCQMSEYGSYRDPDWIRKYIMMQWKEKQMESVSETRFVAVKGDITRDHGVEAVVNAANTSLLGGGGVDGAIHRAAGPKLLAECRLLNGCKTGSAKITKGYQLPCKYVIHTPGPRWRGGNSNEDSLLSSCYWTCLTLAVENGVRTIAFPSISTGIYRFPSERAAKIAVETARRFVAEHPGKLDMIKWVLFDDKTFMIYRREMEG